MKVLLLSFLGAFVGALLGVYLALLAFVGSL
jgi:hypothetical protein